jgi:hypothetical protein
MLKSGTIRASFQQREPVVTGKLDGEPEGDAARADVQISASRLLRPTVPRGRR